MFLHNYNYVLLISVSRHSRELLSIQNEESARDWPARIICTPRTRPCTRRAFAKWLRLCLRVVKSFSCLNSKLYSMIF